MVIFLIGYMGSGKSYYAEKIASVMQIPYVDLDAVIEQEEGMSINNIFKQRGEVEFRQLESVILRRQYEKLIRIPPPENSLSYVGLIACGGGTPCFHDNMNWMNEHGLTVWINPSAAILKERLKNEKAKRPLIAELTDDEFTSFVDAQLMSRAKYYSLSKIQITNTELTIRQIINQIQHA